METVVSLMIDIFTKSAFFMGIISLIGLVLRKEKIGKIIDGTVKTMVGLVLLSSGVHIFITQITPMLDLLKETYGIIGLMPDNQAPFSLIIDQYAITISAVFVISFILHILILSRLKKVYFKNIFLSAHIMIFLSGFYVLVLTENTTFNPVVVTVIATILQTATITLFPAISRRYTKEMVGDEFTLGHMFNLSVVVGHYCGKLFKSSEVKQQKETVEYNFNVILAVTIPCLFLILGLFIGAENVATLSGDENWIVYLLYEGLLTASGLIIIMYGIKMFLEEIIYSFKGISDKYIKYAVPGLDGVAFFQFQPMGVLLGFIGHILGAVISVLILTIAKSSILCIPSPLYMFFEGALAGVFGYRNGGAKGALLASTIIGVLTHLSVLVLYPLQGQLVETGVIYGGADLLLVAPILWLIKLFF